MRSAIQLGIDCEPLQGVHRALLCETVITVTTRLLRKPQMFLPLNDARQINFNSRHQATAKTIGIRFFRG